MSQIETQVSSIIKGLKTIEELKRVRFIKGYGNRSIENPISGFVAIVLIMDTTLNKSYVGDYLSAKLKGEQFSAKIEIRVYAPSDENGSGLSEVVSEILSGLKKIDTEKIIIDSTATSIKFDTDMNAIYRTVEFTVEFYLCQEA